MEDLIQKFLNFLQSEKSLSKNTLESYKRDIKNYIYFLNKSELTILNSTNDNIKEYVKELQTEKKSASTISRHIASLRSFYQYVYRSNLIKEDPTIGIVVPKIIRKEPSILTNNQIEKFLDQPKGNDLKGFRDKAMLELVYATGMRVTELINLNTKDIDLTKSQVKCVGPNNKERIIPIGKLAAKALNEYTDKARNFMVKDQENESLFVNVNGQRLTRQGFWKIIKYYQEQANIDIDITPHTLRHSFAVHLLENGADIDVIQEMLGHTDKTSTQIYAAMTQNRMKDVYSKSHPRA